MSGDTGSDEKVDVWMPLYPADWDADTGHLACEEVGAYLRIVLHYWRKGPPTDDDKSLARIVRMDLARWRRLRPAIAAFFCIADGMWRHGRVERELAEAKEKRRRAVERASAGGRGKAAKMRRASSAFGSASSSSEAVLFPCPSPSSTEAEGSYKPSALSGREPPEARHEGASAARADKVGEPDVSERGWHIAAKEADDEILRCSRQDPDRASELAEFAAYARAQAAALRAVRIRSVAA